MEGSRVLQWRLVGLNAWHRTLLRVEVDSFRQSSHSSERLQHDYCIMNHLEDCLRDWSSYQGIVVIEKECILNGSSEQLQLFQRDSDSDTIALLWDWASIGSSHLSWSTGLGFRGVIYDMQSLRSWIKLGLVHGMYQEREDHPLLSKVVLPRLSKEPL
jgi:hypothetical protein